MSPVRRTLVAIGVALTLIVGGWAFTIAGLLAWSGVSTVEVRPVEGGGFSVPIPMAAVEMVAWTAPKLAHGEIERMTIEADLGEFTPAVLALADSIQEIPNGTILEIEDGSEYVRVWQEGNRIRIEVDTEGVKIRLGVPNRSMARTLKHIARGLS